MFSSHSHGNGALRCVHRLRAPAQFESVDLIANRTVGLRRVLGVFLVLYLQCQRYGQSKSCRCLSVDFYFILRVPFLLLSPTPGRIIIPSISVGCLGGNSTGRESRQLNGQEISLDRNGQRSSEAFTSGQTRLSQYAQHGSFFHARPGRYCTYTHPKPVAVVVVVVVVVLAYRLDEID